MVSPILYLEREINHIVTIMTETKYTTTFDEQIKDFDVDPETKNIKYPLQRFEYLWAICNALHQTELQIRGITVPEKKFETRYTLYDLMEDQFKDDEPAEWIPELPTPDQKGYEIINEIFLNAVAWELHQKLNPLDQDIEDRERELVFQAIQWIKENPLGEIKFEGKIDIALAASTSLI